MKIKKLHDKAIIPHYSTDGASAFDLFCYEEPEWFFEDTNHWLSIVNIGWAFEIPEEYGMFIFSRSGHGFKYNTQLINSVGIIDNDYRGEIKIKLISFNTIPPHIKAKQAVAQAIILHTPKQYFEIVDELSDTKRGSKGFGSTDK